MFQKPPKHPVVAVVMGSHSDWQTMQVTVKTLEQLCVPYDVQILSAHRTPDLLFSFAESAGSKGYHIIIAGAGGAAHLPGMLAAKTPLPVIGVPIHTKSLNGLDSLLSMVQMPGGVPVATVAIGEAGAKNAAILAASILALLYPSVASSLQAYREQQTQDVLDHLSPDEMPACV